MSEVQVLLDFLIAWLSPKNCENFTEISDNDFCLPCAQSPLRLLLTRRILFFRYSWAKPKDSQNLHQKIISNSITCLCLTVNFSQLYTNKLKVLILKLHQV